MNRTAIARRLRREQTDEEKKLWQALRAGRFAGFKFRRQHPIGNHQTGCISVARKVENIRFIPPNPDEVIQASD